MMPIEISKQIHKYISTICIILGPFPLLIIICIYILFGIPVLYRLLLYFLYPDCVDFTLFCTSLALCISWLSLFVGSSLGYYYFKRKNDVDIRHKKLLMMEDNTNKLFQSLNTILSQAFILADSCPQQLRPNLAKLRTTNDLIYSCVDMILTLGSDENDARPILKLHSFIDKIDTNWSVDNLDSFLEYHKSATLSLMSIRRSYMLYHIKWF